MSPTPSNRWHSLRRELAAAGLVLGLCVAAAGLARAPAAARSIAEKLSRLPTVQVTWREGKQTSALSLVMPSRHRVLVALRCALLETPPACPREASARS